MKLCNPLTNGVIVASEDASKVLLKLGYVEYKEPVVEESPAPEPTPKKAPAKRAPRKTTPKDVV